MTRRRLARARERMHHELDAALSLEELADTAGLSPYHFSRAFRAAYGAPPHRYLTALRLREARWLLARDTSVTETCMAVGFSSLGSFSSLFRREVGRSPREFQRAARRWVVVPARPSAPPPPPMVPMCFALHFGGFGPAGRR